jgi:type VI secretion system secreted protein Hcp
MALLILFTFLWVTPAPAFAAPNSQILLMLDGIRGESTNAKYKDAIDISSFSFGAAVTASGPSGGGQGNAGKPSYSDFNFMKQVDSASVPLLKNLAKGAMIPSGTIYFLDKSGTPYLVIRLKKIVVTSVQYSGSSNSDEMTESVSLSAKELVFEYTPSNNNGKPGPKQTVEIDIAANVIK